MAHSRRAVLALIAVLLTAVPAAAADLVIGRSTEPSALDPLFSRTGNNQMTADHIFDRLISTDENLQVKPGLASAWTVVDPLTWEITLRPGVTFHDGSPLTATDVAFSIERARAVPNSPAPFSGAVGAVERIDILAPDRLRIRTRQPTPLIMEQIGLVYIMSKAAAEGKTTADLNDGKGLIGTGPYRFVAWERGQSLKLTANPAYWGGRPTFDNVTLRFIPSAPARVAALLSGQVDLMEEVPITDVDAIKAKGFGVFSVETARIVYLALDSARDRSPFVTDASGRPLDKNPLRDPRVRLALSKMIDRQAIVTRLLAGAGVPAAQMVPEGLGGFEPALRPERADVAAAKALLAEAGFPNGFGLTIHTSSDRFPGDKDLGQAIGQFLARGGIKVNGVEAQVYASYAAAASRQEFSAFVFSFGSSTSNAVGALLNVLATNDPQQGTGAFNRSRYSNPTFDAALKAALGEFDEAKRNAILQSATRIAAEDTALIPLYFQKLYWAARPGLDYVPSKGEETVAMRARVK